LVTSKIYKNFQTFNIHPSWLPKYKGLNALSNQIKKKERFIGATLHIVDSTIDGGKFLFKIKSKYNMKNYKNISYIQKTFLCLLLLCFLSKKTIDLRKINKMFFFKKINCAKIKNNIS